MATNDQHMRAGTRARLARSQERDLALSCRRCGERRTKLGTHEAASADTEISPAALAAWLVELEPTIADPVARVDAAHERARVASVCYHTAAGTSEVR